jgi:DNA gyrase inhibitor GyrI
VPVDFAIRKSPEYRIAERTLTGKWPGDKGILAEFTKVQAWAKEKRLRTGKWFFLESGDEDESPNAKLRMETGIEIRGTAPERGGKGITLKTLPASLVATVTFDPDEVSPRVIYHGLNDWLRHLEKAGEYKELGPYREVYPGNPWASKEAWAHTQIQVPVKRL